MRRIIFSIIILITSNVFSHAQGLKKAEKESFECIDNKLGEHNFSTDNLLKLIVDYYIIMESQDIKSFNKIQSEVDSIFILTEIYKNKNLDLNLLVNCLETNYRFDDNKTDTTTSYYNLLMHLRYLIDNPALMQEISPYLRKGSA